MRTAVVVFCVLLSVAGCGYGWQSTGNHWKGQGVQRVYVRTLENNTLRPGVEVQFTSALVKEFSRGKRFALVNDEKDADAVIEGTLTGAASGINNQSTVSSIAPLDPNAQAMSDFVIATDYNASASMTVRLVRAKDKVLLWTQSFSRSKIYPGGNRFGLVGTTSALINSSQEQLALGEIAQFLASDIQDTMMEAF